MWIVDVGKKPMIIQCSNYECMCKFAIVKEEIRTSNRGIKYIKCPVCGKEIRLIEEEESNMNYYDIAGTLQTYAMKFQCLTTNSYAYYGTDIKRAIKYLDDVIFDAREFKKKLKKELKNG